MTRPLSESHPLLRLFRGLTEATFQAELGIADPPLVDYVADLLARFVPSGEVWRIRDTGGTRLTLVSEMVAEAEASADDGRRRDCHRHVGDFTLFWTGLYPEALSRLRAADRADALLNFQRQGKRSYHLASTLDPDESDLLGRLSVEFERCAYGLSRVRREWERWKDHRDEGDRRLIVA